MLVIYFIKLDLKVEINKTEYRKNIEAAKTFY